MVTFDVNGIPIRIETLLKLAQKIERQMKAVEKKNRDNKKLKGELEYRVLDNYIFKKNGQLVMVGAVFVKDREVFVKKRAAPEIEGGKLLLGDGDVSDGHGPLNNEI